ncbi:MAG TPA: NAD(P)-binding protein, partial [Pyrinomonadaceae bacterium]|nr:NAD(P)-binding protein [Pyrinomonadaceae bacterium]
MNISRRELLAMFLGAPFALAACSMEPARRFPEGEIVGQSVDLGHIIRSGQNFEVPAENWQTVNTAIIGAGIAGLTAAWKFKREDFNDFVVLELEKVAGGTARSGEGNPVGYPWGAHYVPVPFEENRELRALLG